MTIHDLDLHGMLDAVLEKVTQRYSPQMVVQHDHVNPIVESIKKNHFKKHKKSKYSCAILIPKKIVPVFFFDCPLSGSPNKFYQKLRSEPSDRTTSPGTGGSPRNSWQTMATMQDAVEMGVGFLGQTRVFCL